MSGQTIQNELVRAAAAGDLAHVLHLLTKGADIEGIVGDVANEAHTNPLQAATDAGHRHVVQGLLDSGANPNGGANIDAITAALLRGHDDIADLLYSYGGKTRLLIGLCIADRLDTICEILDRQPGRWGEYALDTIRSGNERMVAHCLRCNPEAYRAKLATILGSCVFQWRLAHHYRLDGYDGEAYRRILAALLDHGFDCDVRNEQGQAVLHRAAGCGASRPWSPTEQERVNIALTLLDHGAEINARDNEDKTPLAYARELGHKPIASLLAQRGATD